MKVESEKAYKQILKLLNKHKDVINFDVDGFERIAKNHLFGLKLQEEYGINNINSKHINNTDWIDLGEWEKIGFWCGNTRKINCSLDGSQPKNEHLYKIGFSIGPYLFGIDGGLTDKEYPTEFFNKFWLELKTYKPDFIDERNSCLYWKLENAREIANSFKDIMEKYNNLNKEDVKQRRIKKMEADLEKLKTQ